jgi:hypothetical protein
MLIALIPLIFILKSNTKQRKEGKERTFFYYSISFILFVSLYIFTNILQDSTQKLTIDPVLNATSNSTDSKMNEMIQSAMINDLKKTLQHVGNTFHDL